MKSNEKAAELIIKLFCLYMYVNKGLSVKLVSSHDGIIVNFRSSNVIIDINDDLTCKVFFTGKHKIGSMAEFKSVKEAVKFTIEHLGIKHF